MNARRVHLRQLVLITAGCLALSVTFFAPRLWLMRHYVKGSFQWDRAHTFLLQCEQPMRRDIEPAMHWRLLPPVVCHALRLPDNTPLALPWLGIVAATAYVAVLLRRRMDDGRFVLGGTLLFATTSAVLVPVGWLGMNDAWVWLGLLARMTGGGLGIEQTRWVLVDGAVPPGIAPHEIGPALGGVVDPGLLREIRWRTPAWLWLVPFVGSTVAYLFGTIAAICSNHPWRWLVAPFVAFAMIRLLVGAADLRGLANAAELLLVGPYGLEMLFSGSNESAWMLKTTLGEPVRVWRDLAEPARWLTTVILWGVPALAGVVLAARRHHEP